MTLKILIKKPIALNGITQAINGAVLSASGIASVSSNRVTTNILYPQLAVSKSVDSATVYAGNVLTYTIIVSNNGTIDATNSVLQDSIPSGTTYVSSSTKLNNVPVTDVSGTSALVAGLSLATISSSVKDTVVFKVKVNLNAANGKVALPRSYVSNRGSFPAKDAYLNNLKTQFFSLGLSSGAALQ